MLKVALPPLSVPVPMVEVPFIKVTLPVGVPLPGDTALTVAVKVTVVVLELAGLGEEVRLTVVLALLTVWLSEVLLMLLPKFVSPL